MPLRAALAIKSTVEGAVDQPRVALRTLLLAHGMPTSASAENCIFVAAVQIDSDYDLSRQFSWLWTREEDR